MILCASNSLTRQSQNLSLLPGVQASPGRDEVIHKNVGGVFGVEFNCGESEHARKVAKAIREEDDV